MAVAVVAQAFPTCSCSASYCRRNETVSSSLPLPRAIFPFSAVSFSLARKLASPSKCNGSVQRKGESILLCTNAESVDVVELSGLLAATRQNCEQFPKVLDDGSVVPVDPVKLRRALRHSTVVVALYVETRERRVPERLDGGGWRDYWMPQVQVRRTLIAFGRATSDHTLTASIYDLVVSPSYQRSGYGSRVLLEIVRRLRRRGISDIAATTSPELRPFFHECGFGPDTLKSVTMMYTRGASSTTESWQIKNHGRKSLLMPPPLVDLQGKTGAKEPRAV